MEKTQFSRSKFAVRGITLPRLIVTLAVAALLLGGNAVAATTVKKPLDNAVAQILNVSVDRGVPVTLSGPAASVFIANPDVADIQVMSPTSIMVFGKRTGQTTLMATDTSGVTLLHRTVAVTQNLTDLRIALDAVIPGNKIKTESVPNAIVLTGEARDPGVVEDARRLALRYVPKDGGEVINRIKVLGGNQIQIRVRFAEVSRDVDKRFGIDWESIGSVGGFAFGLATGAASGVIASAPNLVPHGTGGDIGSSLLNRTRPNGGSNNVTTFSYAGRHANINGMIDALAQDGFITVLAEPNLTAMSGETASFLAGGEYPIPVPQSQNTISIEYKTYGVSLAFTPTLIGEDRINLHVRPEVSQLTDVGSITLNSINIPALTTRRADTTIELASGQSFAIGGLLNNNQNQSVSKYPFLGDMPILGQLFRSTRFQNNQSELVIIITPYVVKPATEEQLAMPTDGYSSPSDVDQVFRMRTNASDPAARPMSGEGRTKMVPDDRLTAELEVPAPAPAPVQPVTATSADRKLPAAPVSVPMVSAPRPAKNSVSSPAGPGGFILE